MKQMIEEKLITGDYRGFGLQTAVKSDLSACTLAVQDNNIIFATTSTASEPLTSMEKMQAVIDSYFKEIKNHVKLNEGISSL